MQNIGIAFSMVKMLVQNKKNLMRKYLTDEEKELEKLDSSIPEHTPVVPYNFELEKQKIQTNKEEQPK